MSVAEPEESDLDLGHRRFTPPPVQGTPAVYTEATHARVPYIARETWTPPIVPEPILRAAVCPVAVTRARPTAQNPNGTVKAVLATFPPVPGHVPSLPSGATTALKHLADATDATVVLTYARGFDVNGDGTPRRAPIWEIRQRTEDDPTSDSPTIRTRVGEKEPEPIDSILVRAYRKVDGELTQLVAGYWTDGKPSDFYIWSRNENLVHTNYQTWYASLADW